MDIYLQNCFKCGKRVPVAAMIPILGKRHCEECGAELAKLIATQNRELRTGTIRVKPIDPQKVSDRQAERNKHKPDVMDAKIPPRKRDAQLWPRLK